VIASVIVTEVIWDGKYRDGKRVAPVRIALPFQTVETVNESARDRARSLDLFASGKPTEWRNRLIWGDKKYVLPSLLPEFAGKVNLVYIDPPFDTGADFSFSTEIPDTNESLVKEPSMIEQKAYRDTWGRGLDSYLQWFAETATLLRDLLSDDGSLYVHLDYHVSHYAKAVLDELFGAANMQNEVIWKRSSAHSGSRRYSPVHDTILFYAKGDNYTWNQKYEPLPQKTIDQWYNNFDESGHRFNRADLTAAGTRTGSSGKPWRGVDPTAKGRHWAIPRFALDIVGKLDTPDALDALDAAGRIFWPKKEDGIPMLKRYIEDSKGVPALDVISDIAPLNNATSERTGYPTQKPEELIRHLVEISSNRGDLVLDCFSGSGTTAAVAETLARRWIACDLGRFSIHTTRKRLLAIEKVKPFVVQNLGKYERKAWMAAEFEKPEDRAATENAYRLFILDLYRAEPISGHAWLHGVKGARFVHVGTVDSPVTLADVNAIARDVWRTAGKTKDGSGQTAAVDILGWEFAFELNEMAKQTAAEARVDVRFKAIPRDVLDRKAIEQGDIHAKDFFELRVFSTKSSVKKRVAFVEIVDFMMPAEDLPEEVRKAVKHWSQWIDYWAMDWDFKGDTFHNEWQSYRSRDQAKLELAASREYKEPGTYSVVIKVIDLLGCDTTKMISLEVK
jgi:DNA modification methylase